MKNASIRSAIVFLLAALALTTCEKEHFYSDYAGIYGCWTISDISGGFSGGGYEPDFDILKITNRMHYSLYLNNTLLSEGKIEILEQTSDILKVEFNSKNDSGGILARWEKEVYLGRDTLVLNDECCDLYSYLFLRSESCDD